jgi:DNA polymerase
MPCARAYGLPGALGKAAAAIRAPVQKDTAGDRLIRRFCIPRNPTKHDARRRIDPATDAEGPALYAYGVKDVETEATVGAMCPPLGEHELEVWKADQRINARGVHVDRAGVDICVAAIEKATRVGNARIAAITGGVVGTVGELESMGKWLEGLGVPIRYTDKGNVTLKKDVVAELLAGELPPDAREVLELRASLGSNSVKKTYAIQYMMCKDGRLRDLFVYYGAERTGRWAGYGPQPQNLPAATVENVDATLAELEAGTHPDPVAGVMGCLRGLFCAAPGHDLICSDYSAIEAVVLAELAGEEWRREVFRTHGKIYEMSASRITGVPFEEFERVKRETGNHHTLRKSIGKVAELASGYGGWIGAWKAFGAAAHFATDADIKAAVIRWRDESPAIVEYWGGQWRKHPHAWEFTHELYGLEGAAVRAIQEPGTWCPVRSVGYVYDKAQDVLFCRLPSGRFLSYREPRLADGVDRYSGRPIKKISFMGWNSDYKRGSVGWMRLETYGGRLCENITQATARDLLAFAIVNLERRGYRVVLHVHDEIVVEVPHGHGSVEEVERIMGWTPLWAKDWPVRASGGWRGRRYRK